MYYCPVNLNMGESKEKNKSAYAPAIILGKCSLSRGMNEKKENKIPRRGDQDN
jgi:hypothetical protein